MATKMICFNFLAGERRSGGFVSMAFVILFCIFVGKVEVSAANNPLNVIRADTFDGKSIGIKTEACSEGGMDVCSIHNGDYLVYKAFDFDSGVAAFKARIATQNAGSIDIRLDRLDGALLASCDFENTGGWQDWRDLVCKVDNSQAGVRDVYLIF